MARLIVRYSLNYDDGTVSTPLRTELTQAGFVSAGTATWELADVSKAEALEAAKALFDTLTDGIGTRTSKGKVDVDHVWLTLGDGT